MEYKFVLCQNHILNFRQFFEGRKSGLIGNSGQNGSCQISAPVRIQALVTVVLNSGFSSFKKIYKLNLSNQLMV